MLNEKDIKICGHGSNVPSLKNMHTYCETRHTQKMSNGMTKELLEVRRFLTKEQSLLFASQYKILLGRNIYNQSLRQYVFTPHNGKYYSDCSSSICACYKNCGADVSLLNTDGMHNKGEKVNVRIEGGHIVQSDLSLLQVGDALLFRGNIDRAYNGYIGHVEAVFELCEDAGQKDEGGSWVKNGHLWKRIKADGTYAKSEWLLVNHHWYYFGANGTMLKGWQTINGRRCYLEESGDFEGAMWHEADDRLGYLERWYV